jgi:hypothetical protein
MISAITDMGPIQDLKGVQRITGCLAALSRFIARLGECSLPLYHLTKKSDHFTWTTEAQEALDSLKNLLKIPLVLTMSAPEELMPLYIVATTQVVSATLVVEREEPRRSFKVQRPVYFISKVLFDSKIRYSHSKASVYCSNHQVQALTLLQRASHHSGVHIFARGSDLEPQG